MTIQPSLFDHPEPDTPSAPPQGAQERREPPERHDDEAPNHPDALSGQNFSPAGRQRYVAELSAQFRPDDDVRPLTRRPP